MEFKIRKSSVYPTIPENNIKIVPKERSTSTDKLSECWSGTCSPIQWPPCCGEGFGCCCCWSSFDYTSAGCHLRLLTPEPRVSPGDRTVASICWYLLLFPRKRRCFGPRAFKPNHTTNCHFRNTYYEPVTVLDTLCALSHVILTTILQNRNHNCCSTNGKIEAERFSNLSENPQVVKTQF